MTLSPTIFHVHCPWLESTPCIMISTWSTAISFAILYVTAGISIATIFVLYACKSVLLIVLSCKICGFTFPLSICWQFHPHQQQTYKRWICLDVVSGSQVFRFHSGLTDFKTIRDNLTSVTLPQCIEACEKDPECNFFTFQADKLGDCRTSRLALMNNSSKIPNRLYEKVKPDGLLVEFSELLARGELPHLASPSSPPPRQQ